MDRDSGIRRVLSLPWIYEQSQNPFMLNTAGDLVKKSDARSDDADRVMRRSPAPCQRRSSEAPGFLIKQRYL